MRIWRRNTGEIWLADLPRRLWGTSRAEVARCPIPQATGTRESTLTSADHHDATSHLLGVLALVAGFEVVPSTLPPVSLTQPTQNCGHPTKTARKCEVVSISVSVATLALTLSSPCLVVAGQGLADDYPTPISSNGDTVLKRWIEYSLQASTFYEITIRGWRY